MTVLFRNKILVFNAPLTANTTKPPDLIKQRELHFDQTPQTFSILQTGEIMTGGAHGYCIYGINSPNPVLVLHKSQNNAMSQSLLHQAPGTAPMEALLCYELEPYQEFLLCFSKFGIYITYDGKRARQSEIMWPSQVLMLLWNLIRNFNFKAERNTRVRTGQYESDFNCLL